MGRYEEDAKNEANQLCFKHSFSEAEMYDFAQDHGYPLTLKLMQECVDENMKKQKKGVPIVSFHMLFRRKTVKYKNRKKNKLKLDVQREEMAHRLTQLKEEHDKSLDKGFTASYDQLTNSLVKFKDKGMKDDEGKVVKPSDEDYERGLKFLIGFKQYVEVKKKSLDVSTA